MADAAILFHNEDIAFVLKNKTIVRQWLTKLAEKKGYGIEFVNYIFCSDAYLHRINVDFLNHDDYTDIITFDQRDNKKIKTIESDIFISIDRVRENAKNFHVPIQEELLRVMGHGMLHLCGYKDKNKTDAAEMRKQEKQALALYHKMI